MDQDFLKTRKHYDDVRNPLDDTLGLSFCKLMEDQPLYDHRVEQLNANAILSVVLVGRGQPLELLRDKVLSNGQLLDTDLEVTVVTPEPEADMDSTHALNPDLHRFIRIVGPLSVAEPEWDLGTLHYVSCDMTEAGFAQVLEQHKDHTYFLFSEDRQDLAKLCARDTKRVVACIKKQASDGRVCYNIVGNYYGAHVQSHELCHVTHLLVLRHFKFLEYLCYHFLAHYIVVVERPELYGVPSFGARLSNVV